MKSLKSCRYLLLQNFEFFKSYITEVMLEELKLKSQINKDDGIK